MLSDVRRGWFWAGALAVLYSVPSMLFFGFTNIGNFTITFIGAAFLLYAFFAKKLGGRARMLWCVLVGIAASCALLLTCVMLWAAHINTPPKAEPVETVIVLGAKINGDKPSRILEARLAKALPYLEENPQAGVVVSGGLGEGEVYTEAAVMREWFIQHGVPAERIYEEGSSVNTGENLAFSAAVIKENGLSTRVAICTDGFHQTRSGIFARFAGLTPYALSSATPPGLIPMYYAREWLGIPYALVFRK